LEITLNKKNSTDGIITIKLGEADYQPKVEQKLRECRPKKYEII
jgi:hypothetical protein